MSKKALFPIVIGLGAIIVLLILKFPLWESGTKWDINGFTDTAFANSAGMTLVRIEPGTFLMGQDGPPLQIYSLSTHHGDFRNADPDEAPVREVTISHPFYMGVTEVTLGQYRQFDPGYRQGRGGDDEAASGISWHQAVAFCRWLSEKEGLPYRLPTEAEWEYACRAGTTTFFNTGDSLPDGYQKWFGDLNWRGLSFPDDVMPPVYVWKEGPAWSNFLGQKLEGPRPVLTVATNPPNAWGLHDMHGNVAEWCLDWYGPYEAGAVIDPLGRSDGDFRVFRGGSHSNLPRMLRSANRSAWLAESVCDDLGFRVVLGNLPDGVMLPPPEKPLNAQNVSQKRAKVNPYPSDEPFFNGPVTFVHIPDESYGPLFSRHNHSPSITECPNGDMLVTWFSCLTEVGPELSNPASRLRYGSSEWEPASLFWDAPDINEHAPKLWWDGRKTIYHFTWNHAREIVMRTSTDNGVTWSKGSILFPDDGLSHELANGMIRTREGYLMMALDKGCVIYSRDEGKSWEATDISKGESDIRPGGSGYAIAGMHSPVVQLNDGRLLAISRLHEAEDRAVFNNKTPFSYSDDLGHTWTYEESEFPAISNTQRAAMIRLKDGPILLCSFTDQWRDRHNRKGMTFNSKKGPFTGYGLFAALSFDEGKTWPYRRLITPGGAEQNWGSTNNTRFSMSDTMAEPTGYLAVTQTRDGLIHLITSRNHYVFNQIWMEQLSERP